MAWLLLGCSLACISNAPRSSSLSSLSGVVYDAQSFRPLAGAQVVVTSACLQGRLAARTDARGSFQFTEIPACYYTMFVAIRDVEIGRSFFVHRGSGRRVDTAVDWDAPRTDIVRLPVRPGGPEPGPMVVTKVESEEPPRCARRCQRILRRSR